MEIVYTLLPLQINKNIFKFLRIQVKTFYNKAGLIGYGINVLDLNELFI